MREIRQHQDFLLPVACVAAVPSPFPDRDRTSERKSGRAKEHAWGEQKIGKRWAGGEREGGGGGEKRNRLQSIQNRGYKRDVYCKRQAAKIKLLPSVFSSLYSRIKIFVFAENSKGNFPIFA